MNSLRLLHTMLALTMAMGALLLGFAESNPLLPLAAWLGIGCSYYVVDVKRWFSLNAWLANIGGLGALAVALVEFSYRIDDDTRLLAMTNLLVYLQIVVSFQRKSPRVVWQLVLLSFLQVAVGSALSLQLSQGILLLIYELMLLVTLMLFLLEREVRRFTPGFREFEGPAAAGFVGRTSSEDAQAGSVKSMAGMAARLMAASTPLVVLFFCLVPRFDRTQAFQFNLNVQRTVGFSETVKLTESGEITQRRENAMRVAFKDSNGQPIRITGDLALRGKVLSYYREGLWKPGRLSTYDDDAQQLVVPGFEPVTQEVTIEGVDSTVLFATYPIRLQRGSDASMVVDSRQLMYMGRKKPANFTYEVTTYAIEDNRVLDLTPVQAEFGLPNERSMLQLPDAGFNTPLEPSPNAPREQRLTNLRRFAAESVAGLPRADVMRRARALESALRDSGRFRYDLDVPERTPGIDPIEDFVSVNPSGHCEFFASALALMLRSQGIPSRMVVGFRTGDWNSIGSYYQVRQLHAHTWVEVYLRRDQLPADRQGPAWRNGGWLRLDPTPAFDDTTDLEMTAWDHVKSLLDYCQLMWTTYVVDMDVKRQQESVYQPIRNTLGERLQGLFSKQAWLQRLPLASAWLRQLLGRHWFAIVGSALFVALVVAFAVGYVVVRRIVVRLWGLRRQRRAAAAVQVSPIEFYRRFEKLLRRQKLERPAGQTQQEFALVAGGHLADQPHTHRAAGLPRRICEVFYRVRFGGRRLDNQEIEAVEHALAELESTLGAKPGSATGATN